MLKIKLPKRAVSIALAVLLLGGGGVGVFTLLNGKSGAVQLVTDRVVRGTIESSVTGNGVSKAKNSAALTLPTGAKVLEVMVKEGDRVEKGAPLYTLDPTEAEKAIQEAEKGLESAKKGVQSAQGGLQDAQKRVDELNKELRKLVDSAADLTLTAPFDGRLTDVQELLDGANVTKGQKVAVLASAKKLKLSLYYSYAYADSIQVGQAASVSLPSTMTTVMGKVDAVHMVEYVTPEGAMCFEVVITLENPGALAAGMNATAAITAPDGTPIYPYKNAKLAYYEVRELTAKAEGPLEENHLLNYAAVTQGQPLLVLGADVLDGQIEEKRASVSSASDGLDTARAALATANENLTAAQEKLNQAMKSKAALSVVSPITGTVIFFGLEPGETYDTGGAAATVADTTAMLVEAQIDERNVGKIQAGMACTVTQRGTGGENHTYQGTVESVSLTGKSENGVSFFPAVVRVDNSEGSMMTGMSVEYTMVLSRSEDCLIVPVQAVQNTEQGSCLLIRADRKPNNALDLGESVLVPEGFYAVPVVTGLSDNANVEIKSGAEEGTEIFVQHAAESEDSYGGGVMFG